MLTKLTAVTAGIALAAVLSFAVALVVLRTPSAVAFAQVVGLPVPDPPLGAHCACERGLCPLDSNGRRCSCGCAKRADAQPVQQLSPVPGAACTDGMAGGYPCRDIDLMAFLPHAEIGGGSGNDIWGWTDPLTGREYALVGRSTGTSFVDISEPRAPIYLGDLPTSTIPSTWRGIKVFADSKCAMCHSVAGKGNSKGVLDGVASKFSADEIREWLVNPQKMNEREKSTRKPPMKSFASMPKDDLDALVAYLTTLKGK